MTGELIPPSPAEIEGRFQAAQSKWRPYPEYRDSGVEWLGEIPTEWDATSLRRITLDHKQGYYTENEYVDDGIKLARITDIDDFGNVYFNKMPFVEITPKDERSFAISTDDFLFARSGTIGRFGVVAKYERAVFASYLIRFRFKNCISEYLKFYLLSKHFKESLISSLHGGANQNVHAENIKNQFVILPPLSEQHAIAAFLDRETTKIDALIEKKRRLIGLLEEKRAAIISHAVTKGLNPDAPMKDSGVEWLGEIPVGWDVCRLKFAAKLESGHTPSRTVPEYWENCTIPWVTLNDVSYLKNHEYISETENYINKLGLANSSARILPQDTVILSRDATVGRCGILGRPMATSQHFIDWICSEKLNPRYLLMLFREPMQQEFDRLTMGATIRTIGMPEVNSFTVPLPPIYEQNLIVTFVDREIPNIDKLLLKIDEAINKLQEYRTALISAAVTGKIDVREEFL